MDIEQIIRQYIDKSLHMSLATSRDSKPWVSEVHFVYDESLSLYFRSLSSTRHSQEIASNPHVAGNIVRQHALEDYPHAIYFEGMATMVEDRDQQQKILPLFQKRLGADASVIADAQKADGHKFYQITVENWYAFGKFGGEKGQKYELEWHGGRK